MRHECDQRAEHHGHVEFPWHAAFQDTGIYDLSVKPKRTERFSYTHPVDSRIHALIAPAYVYDNTGRFITPGWYVRTPHINQETMAMPTPVGPA